MGKNEKRPPKWKNAPSPIKKPAIRGEPDSHDKETIAWHFGRCDRGHTEWGWDKLTHKEFVDLVRDLCSFETMTWGELVKAVGDKSDGNKHHSIPKNKCCKEAQQRLAEIKQDDVDELFSLRLTNKLRLFGIRQGRVLRLVWHDPDHTVYPIHK